MPKTIITWFATTAWSVAWGRLFRRPSGRFVTWGVRVEAMRPQRERRALALTWASPVAHAHSTADEGVARGLSLPHLDEEDGGDDEPLGVAHPGEGLPRGRVRVVRLEQNVEDVRDGLHRRHEDGLRAARRSARTEHPESASRTTHRRTRPPTHNHN